MVKSKTTKIVDFIIILIALVAILICLLPMLNVAAVSLSSDLAIINRQVFILPVGLQFDSYMNVLSDQSMVRSLFFTAGLTVVSAAISMLMTILCAYPLTQRNFVGKNFFNTMIIITMYFSAGTIPDYLNIKRFNLLDTFWCMILPGCLSVFNMIILKSFFHSIPESLKESAQLDGASHWTILFRIYLPLSTSAIATLTLFYAVGRWNGFQDALLYLSSPRLYPIQLKLYQIISNLTLVETANLDRNITASVAIESMKSATIMFATIPILFVYPWLQKYFITGVTVGAVKG